MGWYRHDVPERDRLVLWDVDHTLINAGGLSAHLYGVVLLQLFGRELGRPAPMAGRTDRAIILDTFTLAGVPERASTCARLPVASPLMRTCSAAAWRPRGVR